MAGQGSVGNSNEELSSYLCIGTPESSLARPNVYCHFLVLMLYPSLEVIYFPLGTLLSSSLQLVALRSIGDAHPVRNHPSIVK